MTFRDYLLSYLNFSISIISRAVEVRLYFIVLNIISCLHLIPYLFELNFRERHFIFRTSFIFKVSDLRSKIQFTMFKKRSYNKVFYETFNFCSMMFDEILNIKNNYYKYLERSLYLFGKMSICRHIPSLVIWYMLIYTTIKCRFFICHQSLMKKQFALLFDMTNDLH